MKNIRILDCTLRDGGFVNEWKFGRHTIYNILNRLADANIDIIELGFLNDSHPYNLDATIMPHSKYLSSIYKLNSTKNPKLVAMIIMGECSIENIGPRNETPIDGIRLVFKKAKIDEALDFAAELRVKGYEIFLQPASVTDYTEEDMLYLVEKANAFRPVAFYIVDTYGLMHKDKVLHYFDIIDKHLYPEIALGYHSHNNFQLSYATSMDILEIDTDRTIMLDSSLLGMGKSAGNLNTELIIDFLNKRYSKDYDLLQILEAIDSEILKIKKEYSWGYTLDGFIAASNDCHPGYVSYLTAKKTLSIKSVNEILFRLEDGRKTIFDKNHIEELYLSYQGYTIDDEGVLDALKSKFMVRNILLLAPGYTLNSHKLAIDSFIKKENPIVISVNHHPERFDVDYVFVNNAKRYGQMAEFLENNRDVEMIVTSNITPVNDKVSYHIVNYRNLIVDGDAEIVSTNAMLMLFNLFCKLDIKKIHVAGFDGFTASHNENYVDKYLSYNTNCDFEKQNMVISEVLKSFRKKLVVELVTPSFYAVN